MHPPFSFPSCGKENGPCTVQKKRPLRRAPARSRLRATGVGGSVQAPILACLRARYHLLQFLGLPSRGGWCGGRRGGYRIVSASLFAAASCPARELPIKASAPTTARAARSEAERAERGAGQMRPCTPTQDAPAPRESAIKPVPHPAAPVGEPSQTRRHHLTPTPVQQLCTHVQSCDQKRFFLFHRARRILFLSRTKREWGAHPPWKRPPGGSQSPRAVDKRLYTSAGGISGTEKRNLS